jgi:hypothetical protein
VAKSEGRDGMEEWRGRQRKDALQRMKMRAKLNGAHVAVTQRARCGSKRNSDEWLLRACS